MILATLLFGCSAPESTGVWMESSTYNWEFFNHRMSHVEFGVSDTEAFVSVVGGTSTTGIFEPLDDGCEADTCDEFPFFDNAEVRLGHASATTDQAMFGAASASLTVTADGAEMSVEIPLQDKGKGEPTIIIRGYSIDTNEPLVGDPACYRPGNGWLPKGFGVAVLNPVLSTDGTVVMADVSARFEAGETFEEERECLDAVIDRAQVSIRLDLLAVVTENTAETIPLSQSAEYAFSGDSSEPGEQPPPEGGSRPLGSSIDDPLVGFSAFDFTFHEVGQSRGAYVRSLELIADPIGDVGSGHATNYSPVTQLSAFDYAFEGTIQAVDLGVPIERGVIDETVEVTLEDDGSPTVYRWSL